MTTASADAAAKFDLTIEQYLEFAKGTGDAMKACLAADPEIVMAQVLRGYFFHLMGQAHLLERAGKSHASAEMAADIQGVTARERCHVAALGAWCAGNLAAAGRLWEAILIEAPRDLLALKLAHFAHFYLGELADHRDSPARVMPAWDESVPGYGYVLGMRAFGLEEAGDYGAAEVFGRQAVELNGRDIWAVHAVAHVMEMQGRHREGLAWVDLHAGAWGPNAHNFQYHLWWHKGLYHLEMGQHDAVMDLYDTRFRADQSDDYLDISNAAAMLMRLELRGVAGGERWRELAEKAARHIRDHILPFADAHYMLCLAGARGTETAGEMLASMRQWATQETGTMAPIMRDVGIPLGEVIQAWGAGNHGRVVEKLMPIRYDLVRIGGSHAQRDIFSQMLIVAALRGRQYAIARGLLAERVAAKPASAQAWTWYAEALKGTGDAAGAARADSEAALRT
ncbi:MAG: tetratricopeptide repeat protein [Alphaproteobacteria bacterium]|nr:tetratricopeptide repeat protein [Alphaproteobacteria bacterium]